MATHDVQNTVFTQLCFSNVCATSPSPGVCGCAKRPCGVLQSVHAAGRLIHIVLCLMSGHTSIVLLSCTLCMERAGRRMQPVPHLRLVVVHGAEDLAGGAGGADRVRQQHKEAVACDLHSQRLPGPRQPQPSAALQGMQLCYCQAGSGGGVPHLGGSSEMSASLAEQHQQSHGVTPSQALVLRPEQQGVLAGLAQQLQQTVYYFMVR